MGPEQLIIICLASVVAMACALPGVFLVLRKVALMSDAISHSILLGIVVAFFIVKDFHSPILIFAAALTGLITVALTEIVIQSRRLKEDAAIGLIFPVFFSIGVILISRYAGDIHLDQDAVLLGEIAFAPFNTWEFAGMTMGPLALWVMGGILLLNCLFIAVFYKELKIATFDKGLSASLGFSPVWIHYGLMSLVSITCVGAFDAVGSILVVALMITPPSAAYLLSESLGKMIGLSVVFGLCSALFGYGLASLFDASIAGSMATVSGVIFLLVLFFSPTQGLLMKYLLVKNQKLVFAAKMLVVQLLDHEGTSQEIHENTFSNMVLHMAWPEKFAVQVTGYALQHRYILKRGDNLKLTPLGREMAKTAMTMS